MSQKVMSGGRAEQQQLSCTGLPSAGGQVWRAEGCAVRELNQNVNLAISMDSQSVPGSF